MKRDRRIELTEDFARQRMEGYDSGHDWWHTLRVRNLSLYINGREFLADPFPLEIAALLEGSIAIQ
jgi:HD superfamily phosphodiesterase